MVAPDLHKITYRLHQQRERLTPNLTLRRNYLTSVFHAQLGAEKNMIRSRIDRLQPGVRRVYLQGRLAKLDQRAQMRPVGI